MKKLLILLLIFINANAVASGFYAHPWSPFATTMYLVTTTVETRDMLVATTEASLASTFCLGSGRCFRVRKEHMSPEIQNEILYTVMTNDVSRLSADLQNLINEIRLDMGVNEEVSDMHILKKLIEDSLNEIIVEDEK